MKGIVTARASFERLVAPGNIIYVDKTSYVYRLVNDPNGFFFISRPRRFGKSLMCSTLDALFSGKKDLFKDLDIGRAGYDFKSHPVLRFDFSALNAVCHEAFLKDFRDQVSENAERQGIALEEAMPSSMMRKLLLSLDSPVIIIDEFDSPLIDAISREKPELAKAMQEDFNAFYKVIKGFTEKIRFFFITGCTKLCGLSIFSAMNNLKDISAEPEYAGMFGYTEAELQACFAEHLAQKLSQSAYKSQEEFLSALKAYYDGYRFSPYSETQVYNPVSIGSYLSGKVPGFRNFWMNTGGLSMLAVTLAKRNDLLSIVEKKPELNLQDLFTFDITTLSIEGLKKRDALSLLYYAGYLTISDPDGQDFHLGFPNTEVQSTFLSSLINLYGNYERNPSSIASSAYRAASTGDVEGLINVLNELYKPLTPMDLKGQKEQLVQLLFKALFIVAGMPVLTEAYAGKGRLDALVAADAHNYIFEFKVDGETADSAMKQIIDRHYAWLFTGNSKPLHLIGIDFRTEEQQIVSYTHQLYGSGNVERRTVAL